MHLLLVDDDPKFRSFMQKGLQESGMQVETAESGERAVEVLAERGLGTFDLLLLDVMLPGSTGWDVLEEMRRRGDPTPVIFLTARSAVEERVKGLRLGADDYIIKPFEFSELLARIEAVRRRNAKPGSLAVGGLVLDLEHRAVDCRGVRIEMSPREFDLLLALARVKGRVLTRGELLEKVWGMDFDPGTNVVNVVVARLRRRLEAWAPDLIRTVVGEGYLLDPEAALRRPAGEAGPAHE
jgi:two-component system copper resistance phosphate regulon response regulator CusR